MGNRLCKKKSGDAIDNNSKLKDTRFDRIITRLHLRPNSWKSESQLSKQVNRSSRSRSNFNKLENSKPISKSTDWIEASLEVPEKDSPIHLRNPKLALIFNQENTGTPTPPPRKHKKGIREKIEAVAKSGLQALQSRKPVEEPLCIKKTINYDCPCHRLNYKHNIHEHNIIHEKNIINLVQQKEKRLEKNEQTKEKKRKKNLSVVSLPNYSDLKFSVAHFDETDKESNNEKSIKSSNVSLPGESKRNITKNYMIRCRSFTSLLPQQLFDKLKPPASKTIDIESDDSFGPLEDWDLGLIEHYNPRDASLPRPRKLTSKSEKKVLSDIESLIVNEEVTPEAPIPLAQKVRQNANENNIMKKNILMENDIRDPNMLNLNSLHPFSSIILTNESSPSAQPSTEGNDQVEHSSLMRILEEFSIKDKTESNDKLQKPQLDQDQKVNGINISDKKLIDEFIATEKSNAVDNLKTKVIAKS